MTYVLIDWLSLQAIAFCSCFFMDIDVMERVPESWMFGQVNRKNQSEEIQRFLNLMWNKFQSGQSDRLREEGILPASTSNDMDNQKRSTLFSANRNATANHNHRITLADQFTWGAVVCAGVFIVVFVCVMAAWWVHKKQQDYARNRMAQAEERRQASLGPFCIENAVRRLSSSRLSTATDLEIQRPPSYFEVIGFFDPPPSYSEVLRVVDADSVGSTQGYDNAAVTIDELPPPFTEEEEEEEESKLDKLNSTCSEPSAVADLNICTVIMIPTAGEGQNLPVTSA